METIRNPSNYGKFHLNLIKTTTLCRQAEYTHSDCDTSLNSHRSLKISLAQKDSDMVISAIVQSESADPSEVDSPFVH